jgi:Tfp pilus assembly protein PilV
MRKLNQTGDTIVEVLIAIVVASAVLVGAYAAASRSSQSVRIAQERAVGAKYAMATVERLHADPLSYSVGPASFCGKTALPETAIRNCSPDSLPGEEPSYYTLVSRSGSDPATYTVTTEWDSLKGGVETVVYVYRTVE